MNEKLLKLPYPKRIRITLDNIIPIRKISGWIWILFGLLLALGLGVTNLPAWAQEEAETRVQVLEGYAETGEGIAYKLPDLIKGQTLYVYVSSISGNLDPFASVSERPIEKDVLKTELQDQINFFRANGRAPVEAHTEFYNTLFLAWDDDSGAGYDSALTYTIPGDGDYYLIIVGNPAGDSSGEYRVTVGLNAPQVLYGQAENHGDPFVFPEWDTVVERVAVNDFTGSVNSEYPDIMLPLRALRPGETLYAYVEATSGNLTPVLALEDFGGKVLQSANLSRTKPYASLSYRFEDLASNYRLRVYGGNGDGPATSGDFRLLVGVNNPDVLNGQASPSDETVLREPIDVEIGVKLHQITYVDQVGERFGAVAELQFNWEDPELAFSPSDCECDFLVFTRDEFKEYATENLALWPDFTVYNQQGNRWTQNQDVTVWPDGRASYFERFTTDFQAPDFKFSQLPFDTQNLYIRVQSLYPEEFFVYVDLSELSAIGDKLGEEEWEVVDDQTQVTSNETKSMFSLRFDVKRKVNFYVFRILVPIVLVVIVSWIIFFLNDYTKRIEAASANLLVFVTFNFTISRELPKLGYLTFMDAILIGVFVVSALVVIFNVSLKRMEIAGKRELAERIDKIAIWAYPLLCVVGGLVAVGVFLI